MKFIVAALLGISSAVKLEHHHHHRHHHHATPLSNFHPWPRNNWESADIDADNARMSNDIPAHCLSPGHCGITSDRMVAEPTTTGPQPNKSGVFEYPKNNMIAQLEATPLSNFHPWARNNWESADIDADNARMNNDVPAHCLSPGHCGITSDRMVAEPTTTGPQPNKDGIFEYPKNNMILQMEATPLSNFHPWPRNNWESADIDADNARMNNDVPAHCLSPGHCGITSDRMVAEPTTTGPQPNKDGIFEYPKNNMILQLEGEPKPQVLYLPSKGTGFAHDLGDL